eukprot:663897_1
MHITDLEATARVHAKELETASDSDLKERATALVAKLGIVQVKAEKVAESESRVLKPDLNMMFRPIVKYIQLREKLRAWGASKVNGDAFDLLVSQLDNAFKQVIAKSQAPQDAKSYDEETESSSAESDDFEAAQLNINGLSYTKQ